MSRHLISLLLLATVISATPARAQDEAGPARWLEGCERNAYGNRSRSRSCELREYTVPRTSQLVVDGKQNGSVAFFGSDRNDVRIVAMIQAEAGSEDEVAALAKQLKVETAGGRVRTDGPEWRRNTSWSVSYHIYVPRQSNLEAETYNGGVSAHLVIGTMRFTAMNGGISLDQVSGDVRGRTTNGGVHARLAGSTWSGSGLDLRTTNGGVSLMIPRGYNAQLEIGTVNGGMSFDFPITVRGRIDRQISTQLGSGGPVVRATTTNGGVRISQR